MAAPDLASGLGTMSSALPDAVNYHRWILELLRPHLGRRALEVGFGYGQYTRELAAMVDELVAVDRAPECLERLASAHPLAEDEVGFPVSRRPLAGEGQGVRADATFLVADLSAPDFVARLGQQAFGSAVCLNVLEHIEHDEEALRSLLAVLEPGGRLLLVVPAHPALFGPMDEMAGHFRRYTRRTLRARMERAGFRVRILKYINPLGGLGWWLNARFGRPRTLSDPAINRQILLFDRYVLPLSRWMTPLGARLFGQSLWAVGVRS